MVAVSLERHDAADGLAAVHQVEGGVYLFEGHGVRDHGVDLDLALHVPVHDLRHVRPAPRAAEGRPLPRPAGDELERAREISSPEPATPMITDCPQPLWAHSRAWRITFTLPMHSKE